MDLANDFGFAKASGEFDRQAPLLRYVAAINPDATKKAFVEAVVALGYNPDTAAIQFAQSRRESAKCGDFLLQADGSMVENPNYDWRTAA
ncbi:MAG: hypothetical protein ACRC1H_12550 [Caldilineaceae bacterium]